MAEVSKSRGWKVHRSRDPEEAVDYLCQLATSLDARSVVRSDQEVFQDLSVDGRLSSTGIEVTVLAQARGLSREMLRQQAATADIGLTGVDYAIAETGSVVLTPRPGLSRLVSLAPPIHVCFVRAWEVVETLDDLFILARLAYHRHQDQRPKLQNGHDAQANPLSPFLPYVNFITGPSRTADIEQQLVVGVHGPREAHMVLLS